MQNLENAARGIRDGKMHATPPCPPLYEGSSGPEERAIWETGGRVPVPPPSGRQKMFQQPACIILGSNVERLHCKLTGTVSVKSHLFFNWATQFNPL
jgi:hypothetical protein